MTKFIGTAQIRSQSVLYFSQVEDEYDFFRFVVSDDGHNFEKRLNHAFVFDNNLKEEQNYKDWKNLRLTKQGHEHLITYKLESDNSSKLYGALSSDLVRWQKIGELKNIHETAAVVSNYIHKDNYVMYFGEKNISVAFSKDLQNWDVEKENVLTPREDKFDNADLEIGNVYELKDYIFLNYYLKKEIDGKTKYFVGAAHFNKKDPTECIWRSETPIWETPLDLINEKLFPLGSALIKDDFTLYWLLNETSVYAISCKLPTVHDNLPTKIFSILIKKHKNNPIISPRPDYVWESRATFNSAALYEDGKVHFLYRALGDKDLSVLGYAQSADGINIDFRSEEPAYIPREPFETPGGHSFNSFAAHFTSGGGYGGIEDPRLTRVDDKIYLTYVAFDGATPPRAAMSSINVEDFLKQNWDKWQSPKLISAPGMINKSAVLLPKKVNGKYVMLHRVYPNILIDYLDDLEFKEYLQGHHFIPPRKNFWDSKKVGAGAPPLETDDGWLLIYQSVGYQDPSRYKIGAMLLDKNNPSKVLYRSQSPIIQPDEHYENDGFKAGVVYPCGAVIMNGKLNVYYGGADTVVCAASADLDTFLGELKNHKEPKLTNVSVTAAN